MFYDEKGIYVVDDFLPLKSQEILEDLFTVNVDFPYFYNSSTSEQYEGNVRVISNRSIFDQYQFTHMLYYRGLGKAAQSPDEKFDRESDWFKPVIKLFNESISNFFGDYNYDTPYDEEKHKRYDFFRVKVNLNTGHQRTWKKLVPHIDSTQKMWSFVYYVNDVPNSHTLLGKEFYNGKIRNNFTVAKKIESKRGRCVMFDSRRYHSAGKCPMGKVRSVVNIMVGDLNDL